MDAQFLQKRGIVGFGQRHGCARISSVSRTPQHESSRGKIATHNQGIRSLERRGYFIGIEVVDRICWDHGLRGNCRPRSAGLQRALVGPRDVLPRRRHSDRCHAPNARRLIFRRR